MALFTLDRSGMSSVMAAVAQARSVPGSLLSGAVSVVNLPELQRHPLRRIIDCSNYERSSAAGTEPSARD
jgi:hypothetical protein